MEEADWMEILGWGGEELEDLRFVGYSYLKQGKYEIALTFFEALVVLSPTNAYDHQTLGALHLQLNNNLMALSYIERALKLEPEHLPTRLNRVKALFTLGYRRQAIQQASELARSAEGPIANQASALLMSHS